MFEAITDRVRSLRNLFDFSIRKKISWGRPLTSDRDLPPRDIILGNEILRFFESFDWQVLEPRSKHFYGDVSLKNPESSQLNEENRQTHPFSDHSNTELIDPPLSPLVVLDVGCRSFNFAPAIEQFFKNHQRSIHLHGIEIDAYRRMSNLRTRADYGHYFARKVENGYYHPMDFLKWEESADFIFLLNPFVTPNPLLAWGLPLGFFKPAALFQHALRVLKKRNGLLLLSSPFEEEAELSEELAKAHGFKLLQRSDFFPTPDCVHEQPRLGRLFQISETTGGRSAV